MQDLGHFPMSENPPKFNGYLLPVLEKIRALEALRAGQSAARPMRPRRQFIIG